MQLRSYSLVPVQDGKKWLRNQITLGYLDYLVKEAHSGGSDEVVWLSKKNLLLKGIKRDQNGYEEINILLPDWSEGETMDQVAVRDEDFGHWFHERERAGGKTMVYLNASCWSSTRAQRELIAARSPLLSVIATQASAWTFSNSPNNHERLIIDMIRKKKTYPQMRERLALITDEKNPFIFPDDKDYENKIWSDLYMALEYSVELNAVSAPDPSVRQNGIRSQPKSLAPGLLQ
jgi:hypothetical protein